MSPSTRLPTLTLAALAIVLAALLACGPLSFLRPAPTSTPEPTATATLTPTATLTLTPTLTPTNTLTPTATATPTPEYVAFPEDCTGAEIGTQVMAKGRHVEDYIMDTFPETFGTIFTATPSDPGFWDFWGLSSDNGDLHSIWLYAEDTGYTLVWLPVTEGSAPNHMRPVTNNWRPENITIFDDDGTEVRGMDRPDVFTAYGYVWDFSEPERAEGTISDDFCTLLVARIELAEE